VKPKSQGGAMDEVMAIGHSMVSKTFLPQVVTDPNDLFTICDCPGFLDNRGAVINVANACNIRLCLTQADSVKVVILLNFNSLKADRARGFTDLLEILNHLFGNELESLTDSVILGLNQVPSNLAKDDLKEWFMKDGDPIKISLAERMFIFDPLHVDDDDNLSSEASSRQDILDDIEDTPAITNGGDVFKTVLTSGDMQELLKITEEIRAGLKTALESGRLQDAAEHLADLERIRVIDDISIDRMLGQSMSTVRTHFIKVTNEFDQLCHLESFDEAEEILKKLKDARSFFGNELDVVVDADRRGEILVKSKARAEERTRKEIETQEQVQEAKDKVDDLMRMLSEEKARTNDRLEAQKRENDNLRFKMEKDIESTKGMYASMLEAMKLELAEKIEQQSRELNEANKSKVEVERANKKLEVLYNRRIREVEKEEKKHLAQHELEKQKKEEELNEKKAMTDAKLQEINKIETEQKAKQDVSGKRGKGCDHLI
jgi:hypothetical protein